jgi:hypothetical protein
MPDSRNFVMLLTGKSNRRRDSLYRCHCESIRSATALAVIAFLGFRFNLLCPVCLKADIMVSALL